MDKHTVAVIFWFVLLFGFIMSIFTTLKAWRTGEIKHSRSRNSAPVIYRREDDSSKFGRYLFSSIVMDVVFFLVLTAYTVALFLVKK